MEYSTEGIHIVADFYDIKNKALLNDLKACKVLIREAIKLTKADLIKLSSHKFYPQGITITAVISESSIDLHTYPEHNYLSVSFYTCGEKANPLAGIQYLAKQFEPQKTSALAISRGDGIGISQRKMRL